MYQMFSINCPESLCSIDENVMIMKNRKDAMANKKLFEHQE